MSEENFLVRESPCCRYNTDMSSAPLAAAAAKEEPTTATQPGRTCGLCGKDSSQFGYKLRFIYENNSNKVTAAVCNDCYFIQDTRFMMLGKKNGIEQPKKVNCLECNREIDRTVEKVYSVRVFDSDRSTGEIVSFRDLPAPLCKSCTSRYSERSKLKGGSVWGAELAANKTTQ